MRFSLVEALRLSLVEALTPVAMAREHAQGRGVAVSVEQQLARCCFVWGFEV